MSSRYQMHGGQPYQEASSCAWNLQTARGKNALLEDPVMYCHVESSRSHALSEAERGNEFRSLDMLFVPLVSFKSRAIRNPGARLGRIWSWNTGRDSKCHDEILPTTYDDLWRKAMPSLPTLVIQATEHGMLLK